MSVERFEIGPGYDISRLVKGGWHLAGGHGRIDRAQAVRDMAAFVEAGITTFDCADIYTGVEEMIGEFRASHPSLAPLVQVHTKFVPDHHRLGRMTRADVEAIIDRSIRRLRAERLDLVQYYWWDPDGVPGFVETGLWLTDLQRAGKVARIGVSNFNTAQLEQLLEAGVPVVTNQPQYSPIDLRPESVLIPACRERGIVQLCYGTLAGRFLLPRLARRAGAAGTLRQPLADEIQARHRGFRRLGPVPGASANPGPNRRQVRPEHPPGRVAMGPRSARRRRRNRRRHVRPSPRGEHRDIRLHAGRWRPRRRGRDHRAPGRAGGGLLRPGA